MPKKQSMFLWRRFYVTFFAFGALLVAFGAGNALAHQLPIMKSWILIALYAQCVVFYYAWKGVPHG